MNEDFSYKIFERMLEVSKSADVNDEMHFSCTSDANVHFLSVASKLARHHAPNPLPKEDPGFNEYEDLLYFYEMWPDNKPDCAMKKRFLIAAYHLCKLHPENIFPVPEEEPQIEVSLESLQEQEHEKTEAEDIATETYVPVKEPEHVFGVLPFEEEDNFGFDPLSEEEIESGRKKNSWFKNPFKRG